MKKKMSILLVVLIMLFSTLAVSAGDIPESLLWSDEAQIFFGEVLEYHPDKENPDIVVSPVKKIKGDVKEGTQQIYRKPNTVGDFEIYRGNIYLFTYYDEANFTDIFDVTTYDTRTLKLKNVEGDMWERFEKYLNDGEYGVAWIEGKSPNIVYSLIEWFPLIGIVIFAAVVALFYRKKKRKI